MKLKKLGLFRKTPNRFFVRKSKQSEEGGSSVKFGELTFTPEEITTLFTGNTLILTKDDERNQIIRENDILKITNFDVSSFKTDMKKVQSLDYEFYICTFLTAANEINLIAIPYDGEETNYDLTLSLDLIDLATEGYVQEAISQIPAAPELYKYDFYFQSVPGYSEQVNFSIITAGNDWDVSTNEAIFTGILKPYTAKFITISNYDTKLYSIEPNYQGKWNIKQFNISTGTFNVDVYGGLTTYVPTVTYTKI